MYGITQRITKKIFIPILCFVIGTCVGYGGTRVFDHYILNTRNTKDYNNGLQHLQNTRTELQRSIEYNKGITTHLDRSAEYNNRAGEIINRAERNKSETSRRISESKGNLDEAIRLLEANRREFERVDKELQGTSTQVRSEEATK